MKNLLIFFFLFCLFKTSIAQSNAFTLPNNFNHFIKSENINWASEIEDIFSFADSKKIGNKNIYDYLTTKVASGELKARLPSFNDLTAFERADYSIYSKLSKISLTSSDLHFMLSDSFKRILFQEILYLENYSLKCEHITVAPLANVAASGISLGLREVFFCCTQHSPSIKNRDPQNLVYLKQVKRKISFDSFPNSRLIKQTFGMNLIQSLWYGASQGFTKIIDLKKNKAISPDKLMNYSLEDSVTVSVYDSAGQVVGHRTVGGDPVFPLKLFNNLEFNEDIYYNANLNLFFSVIRDCYLFTKRWDDVSMELITEKSFKLIF